MFRKYAHVSSLGFANYQKYRWEMWVSLDKETRPWWWHCVWANVGLNLSSEDHEWSCELVQTAKFEALGYLSLYLTIILFSWQQRCCLANNCITSAPSPAPSQHPPAGRLWGWRYPFITPIYCTFKYYSYRVMRSDSEPWCQTLNTYLSYKKHFNYEPSTCWTSRHCCPYSPTALATEVHLQWKLGCFTVSDSLQSS